MCPNSRDEEIGGELSYVEYCDETGKFHFNDWDKNQGFIHRSNDLTIEIKVENLALFH